MLPGFLSLWPLALRRLRWRWRLFVPVLIGALLASALMSSVFIYGDSVRELGLERQFSEARPEDLDISLVSYYAPPDAASYATIRAEVDTAIERNVAWFVQGRTRAMEGATFYVNGFGRGGQGPVISEETIKGTEQAKLSARPRTFFFNATEFERKTTVVAGERPRALTVQGDGQSRPASTPEIPVAIFDETAAARQLAVGDRMLIVPHWDDVSPHAVARITAIVRRTDPKERYWQTKTFSYVAKSQGDNFTPVYVPEETFTGGVARIFPRMLTDYSWALTVDPTKIDANNASTAKFGLERMTSQLRSRLKNYNDQTRLGRVLSEFETKDLFGRIPLLIVTALILGIVFYYLIMIANVIVDKNRGEIALLTSRGADGSQVMTLYVWESALVAVAAFFLGPLIAYVATKVIGYTPAFSEVTDGGSLPVSIAASAYGMSLLGAAISFAALLLPTVSATWLDPLRYKASLTRPAASFFTRYYIDIFLGILAALLYWELTQRGSLVTTTFIGERNVDKALLAAPALFLFAIGLLLLRFFPLAMRGAMALVTALRAAWPVLGFSTLARNPTPYVRPALLLMFAASVAMFAANFGATLERSYRDRAAYASGGDILVKNAFLPASGASVSFEGRFGSIAGTETMAPAYRGQAFFGQALFSSSDFSLLAVDPASFGKTSYFRDDFSGRSLDGLMEVIAADVVREEGLALPQGATAFGVWVRPATAQRNLAVRARIGDANRRYRDYEMGRITGTDWQYFETPVQATGPRALQLQAPLRLVSLSVRSTSATFPPGAVYFDEVTATTPAGRQTIETFAEDRRLAVINDSMGAATDGIEVSSTVSRESGGRSLAFIWGPNPLASTRGFLLGVETKARAPLEAIVSRKALDDTGLAKGDRLRLSIAGHIVTAHVSEVVDFFPTMDPYDDGFIVVNLPALTQRLNAADSAFEILPNEFWVTSKALGAERERLVTTLQRESNGRVSDRQALQRDFRADPFISAGWRGALNIAFVAVLITSLLGFGVYAYMLAQQRRMEFGLLSSMGLSPIALASVVLLEQAVVVVIGLGLGGWIGYELTSLLMPYLGLTEEGARVLPPFVTEMNWTAIIATYAIMAGVFLVVTGALALYYSRFAIPRAMRFGDS